MGDIIFSDIMVILDNIEDTVNVSALSVKRISGVNLTDVTMTASDTSFAGVVTNANDSTGTSNPFLEKYRSIKYDTIHDPNQYLFQNTTSSVMSCGDTTLTENYDNVMSLQYGYFLPEIKFNRKVKFKVILTTSTFHLFVFFLLLESISNRFPDA